MFKNKAVTLILLAAVLVSGQAYGQSIRTIVGKVVKMDVEGGVVTVETGSISKQIFSDSRLNADLIWGELLKDGYVDANGSVQTPFYALEKFSDMLLPKKLNPKKRLIYDTIQKALTGNGLMQFYITMNSDLLQGTHYMASIEIEQGDPVTVEYESTSSKNNIIHLVNNKPEQGAL